MENNDFEFKPLPEIGVPGAAPEMPELEGPVPAGFNERFVAYVVDSLPFVLISAFTLRMAVNAGMILYSRGNEWKWRFFWMGLYVIYEAVLSSGGRATVGKYLLNIRVRSKDGGDLSLPRAFARSLAYFLSSATLNLGYLMALVTPQKRALHDYVAGSRVVSIKPRGDAAGAFVVAASWSLLAILSYTWINNNLLKITPYERTQIVAAHRTISKLGILEEIYMKKEGHYTNDLRRLADLTGNVNAVRKELYDNLEPKSLEIASNGRKFVITAKAKNWRKTEVQVKSRMDAPEPGALNP